MKVWNWIRENLISLYMLLPFSANIHPYIESLLSSSPPLQSVPSSSEFTAHIMICFGFGVLFHLLFKTGENNDHTLSSSCFLWSLFRVWFPSTTEKFLNWMFECKRPRKGLFPPWGQQYQIFEVHYLLK